MQCHKNLNAALDKKPEVVILASLYVHQMHGLQPFGRPVSGWDARPAATHDDRTHSYLSVNALSRHCKTFIEVCSSKTPVCSIKKLVRIQNVGRIHETMQLIWI